MKLVTRITAILFFLSGLGLLFINFYGLTQDIRPQTLQYGEFRFPNDLTLSYEQAIQALERLPEESDKAYNKRVTQVIADGLGHIHWNEEYDTSYYNQQIPIWENYILYTMSIILDMPEYQKYHFADYKRSLERGIGICGDASMIMSQVLDKQNINNQIVSFPGHVIVAAQNQDKTEYLFDADFGVYVPHSIEEINQSPELIRSFYREKGFSDREINTLVRAYSKDYQRWDGTDHFITKKYYFEYISYWLKWFIPLLCLFIGVWILRVRKIEVR